MKKELPVPIKNSQEVIKNSNELDVIVVGKLFAELFKKGELTKGIIENKAKEINSDAHSLILTVLGFCDLDEEYLIYKRKKEGLLNNEEIAFSFLEQIQQKPEPAKIEQEPSVVAIPAVPAAPAAPVIIPEEEPRPAILTPQKVEVKVVPEPPKKVEVPTAKPTPAIKPVESIPKPERKDWREVKRETEVMAVEDLGGSMQTFKEHMKTLGVAAEDSSGEWKWAGGNKKLVFLGDILGDRSMYGVEISYIIGNLAEQAEKEGGQVDFLCGNHDMDFIRFMCRDADDDYARRNANLSTDQAAGIWELAYFDNDSDSELKKTHPFSSEFRNNQEELWDKLYKKMPKILEGMRSEPVAEYFLHNLCNLKVAVVHDDTLYCHTDPTMAMVIDLTKDGNIQKRVDEINEVFQNNLYEALFNNRKLDENFRQIEKVYLDTDNRSYFIEDEESKYGGLTSELIKMVAKNFININDSLIFWENAVFAKSHSINLDVPTIKKNIEIWKNKNDLEGDYVSEVIDILKAFKSQDKKVMEMNKKKIMDKIKKYNEKVDHVENVRNSSINTIIHGHSPLSDRAYNKNNFIIVSPHGEGGTSTIQKNGRIDLVGKSFREQNTKIAKKVPNQAEQEREKQKNMTESVKKLSELFTRSRLLHDAIRKEAEKIKVTTAELAVQFIQTNDRLRSTFGVRLPVSSERTDKAIEKLAVTIILESERSRVSEKIRFGNNSDISKRALEEIEADLAMIKRPSN